MTPEEKARLKIDQMFSDAGWAVVDRKDYSPNITAVAIREGLLENNLEADYFLFINGKAVGVLEAKREEVDVHDKKVCDQAVLYAKKVPDCYQTYVRPLPIIFLSNGEYVTFKDFRNPESPMVDLNRIYTPKEIVKILGIKDYFAGLPVLRNKGLRDCQFEAVNNLEESFRKGNKRALIVLATGAGKTYTACLAAYRFLSYTPMRRILFLVDRNNLGKQAEGEFGMFRLTENGDPFNTIYSVNRLKSSTLPKDSNVVISTIQRLFSFLKGEDIDDFDEENGEDPLEIELPANPNLPKDYFDLIIIDECHRSIYGIWRKVLEYFSTARLVGLTATPVPETIAFFNNNVVVNYSLENSIVDGINVDCRIYRIKTKVTEDGGAVLTGDKIERVTKYTGEVEDIYSKENRTYTKEELNRSIVNPSQIKLILETYRDAVYKDMFNDPQREPNMDYLPKTLIFALNENHATNIVNIAKEVFGRKDDTFVQKITYSCGDSNELIRHFRNDKEFRIAVTCTLVATGTDIKPLEVLIFMRDVASESLYIQMKGRGVRTIGDEQLRNVTPNAFSKDCFYLVDAVGVTEHEKTISRPSDGPTTNIISLERLLELISHGNVDDDNLRLLASRLSRIYNKSNRDQRMEFTNRAHEDMKLMASNIYSALENNTLPPYNNINEPNIERKNLVKNIANYPKAREYLLILNAGFIDILQPGEDTLIQKGFSVEEARQTVSAFEQYCKDNKDEIEALRIIYNDNGSPITYSMLKDLEQKLRFADTKFSQSQLWNSYSVVSPEKVKIRTSKDEKSALTNIIQLVRFAYNQITRLESLFPSAQQRFNLWYGQAQRTISEDQINIMKQVVNFIACNGTCDLNDIKEDDKTKAAQIINAFGGQKEANEALLSLSQFIIYRKTA